MFVAINDDLYLFRKEKKKMYLGHLKEETAQKKPPRKKDENTRGGWRPETAHPCRSRCGSGVLF